MIAAFFARLWPYLAPTLLPWFYEKLSSGLKRILSLKRQPDAGKSEEVLKQTEKAVTPKEREDAVKADAADF